MDIDLYLRAAGLILPILAGVYTWAATRNKDLRARFEALAGRSARQEGRLIALEAAIHAKPGVDDVHKLQLNLAHIGGEMREIRVMLQGQIEMQRRLDAILTRHEDHLLGASR